MEYVSLAEYPTVDVDANLAASIGRVVACMIGGKFHTAAINGKLSLDSYAISILINKNIADALIGALLPNANKPKESVATYYKSLGEVLAENSCNAQGALAITNTSKRDMALFDGTLIFQELASLNLNPMAAIYLTYLLEKFVKAFSELTRDIKIRKSLLDIQTRFYDRWCILPPLDHGILGEIFQEDMDVGENFLKSYVRYMDACIADIEIGEPGVYEPRQVFHRLESISIPEELKTIPGIVRDQELEESAHLEKPIHDWDITHSKPVTWYHKKSESVFKPLEPMFKAMSLEAFKVRWAKYKSESYEIKIPLRQLLEARAAEIGISMLAVARLDEKYNCQQHKDLKAGDRVIVCVLEQSYEAVHEIPSWASERAAQECTLELQKKNIELCKFIRSLGFDAMANPRWLSIPYAVDAGLGQLGLNGQLLTPRFGSRCRLEIISTNMPLDFDSPQDYGIEKICDACQVCARRCPPGAIPIKKKYYRGVMKAKLNTARCFPTVAQAEGCAICLKVCPVQRFGLKAVIDEWKKNKRILGKGSDELEGFMFVDGRYYGSHERPKVSNEFVAPEEFVFDPLRWQPD